MTRKENLLKRNYELRNELNSILGKDEIIDIEAKIKTWQFREEASKRYEYDLREENENLEKRIVKAKEDKVKKEKTDAYYSTEEGMSLKKELESSIETEEESARLFMEGTRRCLNQWIVDYLGSHWRMVQMSNTYAHFQVWDSEKDERVFGQDIEVYVERRYWLHDNKERFETNVGTTGSFNLLDQNVGDRARFYMDLGKFLTNREKLEELKKMMFDYYDRMEEYREKLKELRDRLENPLGLI